jgi:hypothetical protein
VQAYIEVKSTKTKDRRAFEVSLREFTFAVQQGPRFHVYRVYNARGDDDDGGGRGVKVERYEDLMRCWQRGVIQLSGDIRALIL